MISTSLDGSWATVRRGRDVMLFERGAAPAVGQLALDGDDVDVALVGLPSVLLVVSRGTEPKVTMYQPPYLDASARIDLPGPMRLAAVTGPRAVLVSLDGKRVQIIRTAQRALATTSIDPGAAVELAVGLERNQVMLAVPKKLEVWDAVSARPLLRMQLQLPPPPRTVGAAQGHLWATRPGSDEVFVYRLSDGRPFRHHLGAPVEDVICHPASPLLVVVTPRGLVRVHCFAHSLTAIDSPWTPGTPIAQIGVGDDISLIGIEPDAAGPWRVPLAGAGAPLGASGGAMDAPSAADRPSEMRERAAASGGEFLAEALGAPTLAAPTPVTRARAWRDPLAVYGAELVRGGEAELPVVAVDSELGELAHRLHLRPPARRALITLYALYIVGAPLVSLARLAHVLGDWTEPLGQGDLHALAMLRKQDGRVCLSTPVTELLDGVAPGAIRVVGGGPPSPRPGISRVPRAGRSDATIEAELAAQLGRIAVIEGDLAAGLLEARLHGAAAVALVAPATRPWPWPREAGLVVVADDGGPAWIAALPALT